MLVDKAAGALCLLGVSTFASAISMHQLCSRAEAIKAEEPQRFSCVIDLIYRDQTGSRTTFDIAAAEPRAIFYTMHLTNHDSFQNLVSNLCLSQCISAQNDPPSHSQYKKSM